MRIRIGAQFDGDPRRRAVRAVDLFSGSGGELKAGMLSCMERHGEAVAAGGTACGVHQHSFENVALGIGKTHAE